MFLSSEKMCVPLISNIDVFPPACFLKLDRMSRSSSSYWWIQYEHAFCLLPFQKARSKRCLIYEKSCSLSLTNIVLVLVFEAYKLLTLPDASSQSCSLVIDMTSTKKSSSQKRGQSISLLLFHLWLWWP